MVDDTFFREHAKQLTLIRFNLDTVNAMGTGVIKFDPAFPVLAADQQQEIDRSRDPKCLLPIQCHGMKKEA